MSLDTLINARQKGHSLARAFYVDDDIYQHDIKHIFYKQWLFAAPLAAFKRKGDFITLSVAQSSIVLIRGDDDEIRAFHNVCRHRGSIIFQQEQGNIRGKIICPYHQWTYEKNGTLAYASHVDIQPEPKEHSLHPIATAILGAGIHINLSASPPPISEAIQTFSDYVSGYTCDKQKIIAHKTHIVPVNWKLLVENNRECGHCRSSHPELMTCVYDFGMGADNRSNVLYNTAQEKLKQACQQAGLPITDVNFPNDSFYRLARLPFKDEFISEVTTKNRLACKRLLGSINPNVGQLRAIGLPNLWGHYLTDYCVFSRLLPQGPLSTRLDVFWTVHEDAKEESDYNLTDLMEVWEATTAQDTQLVINNQRGINSNFYQPGPYSPITESMVEHFVDWYIKRIEITQ